MSKHQIVIEITDEKEWDAVCALSSFIEKPLSEIAKNDLISMTKQTAHHIKKEKALLALIENRNPSLKNRLFAILD